MKLRLAPLCALLLISAAIGTITIPATLRAATDTSAPKVKLDTSLMGPRAIEDITHKNIIRDYGLAWQTMARALAENQRDLLENGYLVGFAKERLTQALEDQVKIGVRVSYSHGVHNLQGIFYSPDGSAMELRDTAQVHIQVLDGNRVVHNEQATLRFIVLMTPGADRWQVRYLQAVP
jgi:hypothetical protein